jgi:quinoprotein glucose dehydrogenase
VKPPFANGVLTFNYDHCGRWLQLSEGVFVKIIYHLVGITLAAAVAGWSGKACSFASASSDGAEGRWADATGDGGGRRYSPLTQINRGNVANLKVVWTYHTGHPARADEWGVYSLQTTPILVAGNLIGCTHRMEVFALDPETGKERWHFDPKMPRAVAAGTINKCRGVAAWTDPEAPSEATCKMRILHAAGLNLYALDAKTGKLCEGFGTGGVTGLKVSGLAFPDELTLRGPGAIINDIVIFGSSMVDSYRRAAPSGKVRAFDVRTGALRWDYDPIPRDPSDPAYASWYNDSAKTAGASNVWSRVSVDPEHNLVFLPTTSPANDYYGGDRPGDDRWSDSLIALDATTGRQVWAFQTTHHDIWDRDLPSQPILVDIEKDGAKIPAVVQLTKQSFVFVFNRLTGKPIYPIEERPVPQNSDVPGEWLSPTQPFPTVIPPLSPITLTPDQAWGFTPLDRYACRKKIEQYRNDGTYAPLSLRGTLIVPSLAGGSNWGGGAIDAATNLMVVPTLALPGLLRLVPREADHGTAEPGVGRFAMNGSPYVAYASFLLSPIGAPCSAPPWSRLTAIDLNTGKIKWMATLGSIERQAWYAPALMLGSPTSGGAIITGGHLVFIGASTDHKFRAFDLDTGEILWTAILPAPGMATPMTYTMNGRQYVVIAAGGNQIFHPDFGDSLVAFALDHE